MPSEVDTKDRIRRILRDTLRLGPDADLPDHTPLIGGDYDLDSLDILLLVTTIEKEFGIKIEDKAMGRDAFKDLATLAAFVDAHPR